MSTECFLWEIRDLRSDCDGSRFSKLAIFLRVSPGSITSSNAFMLRVALKPSTLPISAFGQAKEANGDMWPVGEPHIICPEKPPAFPI